MANRRSRSIHCHCVVVVVAGLLLGVARTSEAGPIDPDGFTSLGAFPTTVGSYTINTSGTPTITGPGGTSITGVVYTDSPGHRVAVFDFDSISLNSGETFTASGSLPLVLLSRGDATIGGTLNGNGSAGTAGSGGGVGATPGPGEGSFDSNDTSGGGFGGSGGPSGAFMTIGIPRTFPSVPGGQPYGDLSVSLQGGSAGGLGSSGGGGGIEIGAEGTLNVLSTGLIEANGGSSVFLLGGGSGGGIFLHGDVVNISRFSLISAQGGTGGSSTFIGGSNGGVGGGGGGGGGGRILMEYGSSLNFDYESINVQGGATQGSLGAGPGSEGVVAYGQFGGPIITAPEPSALMMGLTAAGIGLGDWWRRNRLGRASRGFRSGG